MIYLLHKKGVVYVENNGFFQQDKAAIHNASETKKNLLYGYKTQHSYLRSR